MVVSDRTQLRLSRALDQPATLRVYDLAGRLIRRLELPLGQQAVSWDTVDDRGRSVASGVYVARLSAVGASATTRVVVVR